MKLHAAAKYSKSNSTPIDPSRSLISRTPPKKGGRYVSEARKSRRAPGPAPPEIAVGRPEARGAGGDKLLGTASIQLS